ncbi:aminoglycoside phosphotransferase family protein [Streptomyces sp. ISL-66]|uniref:aminoglycoside phosphotransferase family protein n=1 Tax=Streptomyces sp. ISL-66 TaxID=2819186 RepID=UPI001BE5E4F3|nr:aminoglycoside phosphotransferase family protein [Streptomyces sp. ISL-66]MBT2468256.1 aminoglycoside phosphotransferase family protein [Streptomyces sp. ISL-66]
MPAGKMHAGEPDVDTALVRRLIAAQFPQWAALPVERVDSVGTSNAMYRLGEDMAVRLPRTEGAAGDVATEHRWLPRLAPPLPVAIPAPLGQGEPAEGYPWPWSVYRWLAGENPAAGRIAEPVLLAEDLARFVSALRRIDPADGPSSYRSETLAARDAVTRATLAQLRGGTRADEDGTGPDGSDAQRARGVDLDAATALWETALRAPEWAGPPVWIHADLQPGNVLLADGRLSAVIDFGCAGLGDPAVDLIAAWYVLPAAARTAFRSAVAADEAMWTRGRGWALSIALLELSYYRDTHPAMASTARRVIGELLADGAAR